MGDDGQSVFLNHNVLNQEWNLSSELNWRKWAQAMRDGGHVAGRNRFRIWVNFNASTIGQIMATWRWATIEMVCLFTTTNDDANKDKSQN